MGSQRLAKVLNIANKWLVDEKSTLDADREIAALYGVELDDKGKPKPLS